MGLIIGYVFRIITFPGMMLDAWLNDMICRFLEIEDYEVHYFSIDKESIELKSIPDKYSQLFTLCFVPFVLMSLVAIYLFHLGVNRFPGAETVFLWLGASIAVHSFPNGAYGYILWTESRVQIRNRDYLGILGLLLAGITRLANLLRIVWLDLLYAVFLYSLVS